MSETDHQRDLRRAYESVVLSHVLANIEDVTSRTAHDAHDPTPDIVLLVANALITARPDLPHVQMPISEDHGVVVRSQPNGSWLVRLAEGYGPVRDDLRDRMSDVQAWMVPEGYAGGRVGSTAPVAMLKQADVLRECERER